MATVDLSRHGTDFRKRYLGMRMQQGRILSDDDFNTAARLDEEEMRRTRVDVIGPVGSPDMGFLPVAPAAPLPPGGKVQFDLAAGTLYLGGVRLEQPAAEPFHLQKDWLNFDPAVDAPNLPAGGSRIDLVWIEAWQQAVAAEEDSEKYEAALGSADTAMNVRAMRRVRVLPDVQTEECAVAWAQATASWAAQLGTMGPDMELTTQARLRVTYTAPATPGDLCSPPAAGGYLGAENQAIRVQMVDAAHYTWGFDNASPLYRVHVAQVLRNGVPVTQVTLLGAPKDAVHWPLKGQVVEILPWSAALPNGETLASLAGHLARVTATYNPDDQTLEIDTPLPAGFGAQWKTRTDAGDFFDGTPADDYFFLRVWNRGDDVASPPAIPVANGDLGNTGLRVGFINGPLRARDFWIIAARPATPDAVVPWRLEEANGAPPHGVKRWRAPLGLIRWTVGAGGVTGQVVHDCRPPFLPLTRRTTCCTVTVGNGTTSFGMFTSIQAAVDALPPTGGVVCVQPGTYNETVVIERRRNIVIHGCDARSRVRAVNRRDETRPAFLIVDSQDIGIEHLSIEAGPGAAVEILRTRRAAVRECVIQMRDVATNVQSIWARGEDIVIDRNLIDILGPRDGALEIGRVLNRAFDGSSPPPPPVLAQAARGGIQLGGGSVRVRVLENVIRGGIWNGVTLGSLMLRGERGEDLPDKPTHFDPCDPCRPLDTTDTDPPDVVRVVSAGDLKDIEIADNVITDMGANGVGVVRFFNLGVTPILVNVDGLHITGNEIRRCVRRRVNPPPQALVPWVGYGGIALATAKDLRVSRNEIVENGVSHMEPICGVFAIAAENVEIDGNRIERNGPYATEEPAVNAVDATRGGIWIWLAIAKLGPVRKGRPGRDDSGVPAAVIRDNVIVAPVGRAITLFALGAMTIARNRLVSQGTTTRGLDRLATTVLAVNLGVSNEWTIGLLAVAVLLLLGKPSPSLNICLLAKQFGLFDPMTGRPLPPLALRWPTGKSLVTENQINCDVVDVPRGTAISSVLVASLDDVAFADNQAEIDSLNMVFLMNVVAAGGSARVADNRLAETWRRAFNSGIGAGLMATVTDNQSTHCMRATALLPGMRLLRDNLHLINAFCPNECGV